MARNDEQTNFRMPAELRQKLKISAAENNRTLTAEIVARLEATFAEADPSESGQHLTEEAFESLIDKVADKLRPVVDEAVAKRLTGVDLINEAAKRIHEQNMQVEAAAHLLRGSIGTRPAKKPRK